MAFRHIAAGSHPDHDKLGTVCLDDTKIHANASRHSALSHGHIEKLEIQLKAEVAELFALAESADQADIPDGVSLPDEIKRREERLALMAAVKVKIAVHAEKRDQREKAEYDEKEQDAWKHRLPT